MSATALAGDKIVEATQCYPQQDSSFLIITISFYSFLEFA